MRQARQSLKLWILSILTVWSQMLIAQSAWNTGSLSFDYATFPFPGETLELSGDLLSDEVPHQGVGGFELTVADTSLITLIAYDLYVADEDTLADIFIIFLSDSLPLGVGSYQVNPSPDALKLFVWLNEVNVQSLAGLLDASFTLDSLTAFDPFISVAGNFDIDELTDTEVSMSFAGSMLGTNLEILSISDGQVNAFNTLPSTAYSQGTLNYSVGNVSGDISGSLNPLTNSEGAGALLVQLEDTLAYNCIAFQQHPQNLFDVYGVILVGTESQFPPVGSPLTMEISLSEEDWPAAYPYILRDLNLEELLDLLESGEVNDPDQPGLVYVPTLGGSLVLSFTQHGEVTISMQDIPMGNALGDATTLTADWLLTNNPASAVVGQSQWLPEGKDLQSLPYPNPFNSSTMVPLYLTESTSISMRVYNLLGQEVYQLHFGDLKAGRHDLQLDLRNENLEGGSYYYTLSNGFSTLSRGALLYLK